MNRINYITDFQARELDVYARMNEAQLRNLNAPRDGVFLAESPKVIWRALEAGCTPISFLMTEEQMRGEARPLLEKCQETPIYVAEERVLRQLTGFPMTRGALSVMQRPTLPPLLEVCQNARRIVLLERVVNPTNIGAIFRSAAALHMDAVLLTPDCSDPLSRRASRVSMGTVFQIPWTYLCTKKESWRDRPFAELKEMDFHFAAMALKEDSIPLDHPSLQEWQRLALVMGNEGEGLPEETLRVCDDTVIIPMAHGVDSLNVAAASAVAFWQLGRGNLKKSDE